MEEEEEKKKKQGEYLEIFTRFDFHISTLEN